MTRKKVLILLGSVCLALMMVAMACAGPAPTPTPTPSPTPSPSPTPTPTPPPTEEVYHFQLQNVNPPPHTQFKVTQQWCDDVKEMTQGQIIIDNLPAGTICESDDTFDALGSGLIDMSCTCGCYHAGICPVASLGFALPGDPRTVLELAHFYYEGGGNDFLRKAYAEYNVYYAAPLVYSGYAMVSREPVESIDDLRNLKVRAIGLMARLLEELGVSTVFIPLDEVYVALSRGTIDACLFGNLAENYDLKMHEVAKYWFLPHFTATQVCEISINMDVWDSLPPHLQATLDVSLHKQTFDYMRKATAEEGMKAASAVEEGCVLFTLPKSVSDEVTKAGLALWDEVATEDPLNAEFLELVREHLATMGYSVE